METEDGGARDNTASDDCPQTPVPIPSSPMEQTGGQEPVSSGVKRDARTAGLPDEDEQGGKFQQVEGLTDSRCRRDPVRILSGRQLPDR